MFRLENQPAKINSHNARNERHGEELKLAGDVSVTVVARAEALNAFDAQLIAFLFRGRRDGDEAVQSDIEGEANPEVSRRLPQLDPLTWNEKFPGFRLSIVKGMGLVGPIVLAQRELSKFVFEPVDGGLVKITFRASGTYDSTAISGELDGLQQREVEISLEPPSADQVAEVQQDLELEPEGAEA